MSNAELSKGKIIKRIIIALLILLVLFTAAVFTVNKIKLSQELNMLKDAGCYNPVSAGDYSINVYTSGNQDGKHRLVALSGGGVSNFGLHLTPITDRFAEDNQIVIPDRAGYGLSDDTKIPQTVEQVVSDYRTALKNAGIEAPYVLLPHSIGGAYATYWVSEYPDEIEGIVFLDGTQLNETTEIEGVPSKFKNRLDIILCDLGFYRLASANYIRPLPGSRTDEEQKLSYALCVRTGTNNAVGDETIRVNENAKFAFNSIKTNDVPKVYICSSWGAETEDDVIENMKWVNEQRKAIGQNEIPIDPSVAPIAISQSKEMRETILEPYLEKMGACELVLLPGDHFIFDQKPEKCADIISDFLEKLDNNTKGAE